MRKIILSVDELIYCLYSEGYFEQGMALKKSMLSDLTDEQFEVTLQVSCRSLLSKNYIKFDEGKFTVTDSVRNLLKFISLAEFSYQGVRAITQEVITIHNKSGEYVVHLAEYDGQIHNLELVEHEEAVATLKQFFGVKQVGYSNFSIQEEKFENMLKSIDDLEVKFSLPTFNEVEKIFYSTLEKTKGYLNTLLVISYTEANEAVAQDVMLFTAADENNLAIVREENDYYTIHENSSTLIKELIK